jgi:hypothetical protein
MQEVLMQGLSGLVVVLQPIILAGLAALSGALVKFIMAKAKNQAVQMVLLKIENMVFTVVREMEQTVMDEIRKASADGVITDAEKRAIKEAALGKLKSYLNFSEIARILGLGSSDKAQALIESKIESAVQQVKQEKSAGLPLP